MLGFLGRAMNLKRTISELSLMSTTPCILSGCIRIGLKVGSSIMSVPSFLHRLAQQLDVGAVREGEVELHHRPVAAEVGDVPDLAERHDVKAGRSGGLSFSERTLNPSTRALDLAAVDILADAEGILGQEEHARHDVPHQRLAAETTPPGRKPRRRRSAGVMLTPSSDSTSKGRRPRR